MNVHIETNLNGESATAGRWTRAVSSSKSYFTFWLLMFCARRNGLQLPAPRLRNRLQLGDREAHVPLIPLPACTAGDARPSRSMHAREQLDDK